MTYLSNPNSLNGGPLATTASSHNTGFFTDNTNPATTNCNVLPSPSSNIVAASGLWGGKTRTNRRKRNSAAKSPKSRTSMCKTCKSKLSKCKICKCKICNCKRCKCRSGRRQTKRQMKGGINNVANTPSFATGTELPYGLSALANPAPYWKLDNNTNCADNYNHFIGGKKRRKPISKSKTRRRGG